MAWWDESGGDFALDLERLIKQMAGSMEESVGLLKRLNSASKHDAKRTEEEIKYAKENAKSDEGSHKIVSEIVPLQKATVSRMVLILFLF